MAQTFILSCESTVDLPYSYIEGRGIPVLFYHYTVNGQDYVDDMGRDPEGLTKFYARIAQGALPSTSQLNTYDYMSFLESLLAQGDVLHIAFGSGMTKSVERAQEAAQALRGKKVELYRADIGGEVVFAAELIGMDVFSDGKCLGKISEVLDYPGNKVYVVKGTFEYMIPAVSAFILHTDLEKNEMQVRLIEGMRSDAD